MNGATRTSAPVTSEELSTSTGIPLVTVSPRLRPLEKKGLFVCKWPQRDRMGGTLSLNWMMTYTGVVYRPFEPNSEDVRLGDIAHALSMICRYGGHPRWFYCVTPETKVLTHDLRWVPAGDIITGQKLWGCDEQGGGHRDLRKWRTSIATIHPRIVREIIEISLSDGTKLRCSEEHPIIVATKAAGNQRWMTAREIYTRFTVPSRRGRIEPTWVPKILRVWETNSSYEAGWLAGMFDGEGSLSSVSSRGRGLCIAQNPGAVLNRLTEALTYHGVQFSVSNGPAKCKQLFVKGGFAAQLALLGSIRPSRLIGRMKERMEGTECRITPGMGLGRVEVVGARRLGKGEVVAMETSTRTYMTEGFISHNSVAEHSVHVSHMVPPDLALEALLHDAAEAYVGDMIIPLKWSGKLDEFKRIEKLNELAIRIRFVLPHEESPEVKKADTDIRETEWTTLMQPIPPEMVWKWPGVLDPSAHLKLWCPEIAEQKFLDRFKQLWKGGL